MAPSYNIFIINKQIRGFGLRLSTRIAYEVKSETQCLSVVLESLLQVTRNAVGCWNSAHEYTPKTQGQVAVNNVTMVFPNDIKVDTRRNLWLLTDRMPLFMYKSLNHSDVNFRILSAPVDRAVAGTVCARSSGGLPTPLGFILISVISSLSKIR